MTDMNHNGHAAQPLLSIIIPTRNRPQYAIPAVRSLLLIPSSEVEFVIQDSSDSGELGDFIGAHLRDPRLRYNYTQPPVNMVQNFSLGVEHSSGEYVCILGDDDGVNPEIVAAARWAKTNNIDALSSPNIAVYCWPDFRSRYRGDRHAGKLYIRAFSGGSSFPVMETALRQCVRNAGQGVAIFHLPRVYEGVVRKSCLDRMRKSTGLYFGGVSPDVFGAVALANFVGRCCEVDYPLIIAGNGGASASGLSAMRQHKGNLRESLKAFPDLDWPSGVPEFYSVETVWAQAALTALQSTGRADLLAIFNFPLLHAICMISNPRYASYILRSVAAAARATGRSAITGSVSFLGALVQAAAERAAYMIPRLVRSATGQVGTVVSGLRDIGEAVRALQEDLGTIGARFPSEAIASVHVQQGKPATAVPDSG